jgi:hypothetical protein
LEGPRLRYSDPFPDVGNASGDTIAGLRRQRETHRFRTVLREVEAEATSGAAVGDLLAAAHHAYYKHLADAVGKVGGIGASFTSTTLGFVISCVAGPSTMGISGPGEALTSAAVVRPQVLSSTPAKSAADVSRVGGLPSTRYSTTSDAKPRGSPSWFGAPRF